MPARIDDALFLADLRRVAKLLRKQMLTTTEYNASGQYNATTIAARFKGWPNALRAAGLEVGYERHMHPSCLIADLRRVAKLLGKRTLTRSEYCAKGRYHATTIARRFKGWPNALRAAGLEVGRERNVSSPYLIADLRRVAKLLGKRTLTKKEHEVHGGRYSSNNIAVRFGSWPKALQAAGLEVGHEVNIPSPRFLADLRRVAKLLGKTPTMEEYDAEGRYSAGGITKHFKGWAVGLRAAGIVVAKEYNIPSSRHIADLRRVAKLLGKRTLTRSEYDANGRHSGSCVAKCFRGWTNALRAAELKTNVECNVSSAHYIADLRRVAKLLGKRTLTRSEYDANGQYSTAAIFRRFGTWNKALCAAKIEVHKSNHASSRLIADLRRVAKLLGKQTLTKGEYETKGRYASNTLADRFKSWPNALRVAGLEVGQEINIPLTRFIADLLRVAKLLGKRTLMMQEYEGEGRYRAQTISDRFRGWPNALRAAGLEPTRFQILRSMSKRTMKPLSALASLPGLTMEDRVKVAKTLDGIDGVGDNVLLETLTRMNLGPLELPAGMPSDGSSFWERCIAALQKIQSNPEKLAATGILERLGRQLHRAVAIEVLGREPLSPKEEHKVARELQRRRQRLAGTA